MRVNIGPYINWYGPYQIVDVFLGWIIKDEDRLFTLGEKLNNTWVRNLCEWVHDKKRRTIKVRIDPEDTWSLDGTLSHIIAPALKEFKKNLQGYPSSLDNKDLPKELRVKKSDPDSGVKAWEYILDEMLFAFESISNDAIKYNPNQYDVEYIKRVQNGLRLFGKYYRHLWN